MIYLFFSLFMMMMKNYRFIFILVSLELMVLNVFFFFSSSINDFNLFFFLTFSVVSSLFGSTMMVNNIKSQGSDMCLF